MESAIEDAVVSAAHAKGLSLNSAVMSVVAVDLAGSTLDGAMITIPNKGTLSIKDYLADLHARAPSGFSKVLQPDKHRTMTERHRAEIAASRQKRRQPDDWKAARERYAADSVTGRMMREREADWK
jgi:hypothetical protein